WPLTVPAFLYQNPLYLFYLPLHCLKKYNLNYLGKVQWAAPPNESNLCWWHAPNASGPRLYLPDSTEKTNDKHHYYTPFRWGHLSSWPLVKNVFAGDIVPS